MKQPVAVFLLWSVLCAPAWALAAEFTGIAGYDCSGNLETARNKHAQCVAGMRTSDGTKRCGDLVGMIYCKKADPASARGSKISLK